MHDFLNSPLQIGSLQLPHRLMQGPLAGFSCAPFRRLFSQFVPPAFCVTEMLSAHDVLAKHSFEGRYLYRDPDEQLLCYQISGNDPELMAEAARKLAENQADLIDINCGCPKAKIRKKGAGSALLEQHETLSTIIKTVRRAISCPLTVKMRLSMDNDDPGIAQKIADAGADALIIHGRRWIDDYDSPCDWRRIAKVKRALTIPVIVNGDISHHLSVREALRQTGCDGIMIARAATGKPWLYQELLQGMAPPIDNVEHISLFMTHLQDLAILENDHQAVLQSKSLVRYYFGQQLLPSFLATFYQLTSLTAIENALRSALS